MIYKSGIVDCYEAFDYVKGMLSKIGNIKEFKSFFNNTDPYFEIVDGSKQYYHLILYDDNGNEFWIDTNCGYGGTGPSFTEKILQLLGAREDYKIDKKRIIHETNLEINNDLNALIVMHNSNKLRNYHILFMLEAKFNNAAKRFKTVEFLETLGHLNTFSSDDIRFNDYFNNCDVIDNSLGQYNVNNILFLNSSLNNINIDDLKMILDTIIIGICGELVEFTIIDINAEYIDQ